MNDEIPAELGRALDTWRTPDLSPVDVSSILADGLETEAARARFWRFCTVAVTGLAAALLVAVGWSGRSTGEPRAELDDMRARLAKLENTLPPDPGKFDAKLAELNDLVLTLAADVNDRDRKQARAIQSLAKQLTELKSLSDRRWTEAKSTADALYILHRTQSKETNR
jgi:hypothetical protein